MDCVCVCFRLVFYSLPASFFQRANHFKAVHSNWILNSETNEQNSETFLCFLGVSRVKSASYTSQCLSLPCGRKTIKHGGIQKTQSLYPALWEFTKLNILKLLHTVAAQSQGSALCSNNFLTAMT